MIPTWLIGVVGGGAAVVVAHTVGSWLKRRREKKARKKLEANLRTVAIEQAAAEITERHETIIADDAEHHAQGDATTPPTGSPVSDDVIDAVRAWVHSRAKTVTLPDQSEASREAARVRQRSPTHPERPSRKR